MDYHGSYSPYPGHTQQRQEMQSHVQVPTNNPTSSSSTSPTLRRIEIRTETSNGEETNIPLTSDTYDHMNQFISNLVQDVNVHNQVTMTDDSGASRSSPQSQHRENPETEVEDNISIMDLQNHTQLEVFHSEHVSTSENVSAPECTCSICHNRIMDGQIVRVLRCSHAFHNDCVDRWLHSAPSCPLCRTLVVPSTEESIA